MTIMTDDAFVRHVQTLLGVTVDGIAGSGTQAALAKALGLPDAPPAPAPAVGGTLDTRSEAKLAGVHPDLVRVVRKFAEAAPLPFVVLEGLRTVARQKQLVASGASQTMRSRHLTGHAVDIAPLDANGQVSWDWPLYYRLEPAMRQAAEECGVPIEWGGRWASFPDAPHWQLPWAVYP